MYTSLANGGHPPSHGTPSVGQSFGAKNETLGVHPIAFQGVAPMTSQMRCSLNLVRVRRRKGSGYYAVCVIFCNVEDRSRFFRVGAPFGYRKTVQNLVLCQTHEKMMSFCHSNININININPCCVWYQLWRTYYAPQRITEIGTESGIGD